MTTKTLLTVRKLAIVAVLAGLAACSAPPPPAPAPPPPPPPAPEPIPMRPLPPGGASYNMPVPPVGPNGIRQTVNAGRSPLEAVWNFRSGWNVAALNCLGAEYQPILDGYKQFLSRNAKRLTAVNKQIDVQYRAEHGSRATREREEYMTQVYNYYALPPAHDYFCQAALTMSQQALLLQPTDVDAFALSELPRLEAAFERFFREMEHYRIAVAEWDVRYGAAYGPGQGSTMLTDAVINLSYDNPSTVPLSSGQYPQSVPVPVVQQPDGASQPVVQPLPDNGAR